MVAINKANSINAHEVPHQMAPLTAQKEQLTFGSPRLLAVGRLTGEQSNELQRQLPLNCLTRIRRTGEHR